jgi:hypothetical protein
MITKTASGEFLVHIPWRSDKDQDKEQEYWNDTCIWAIENFGLPGHRFATKATQDYIDFYFQDEKDALLFSLRWL